MKIKKTLIILIPLIIVSGIIYFSAQYFATQAAIKKIDNIAERISDIIKIEYDSARAVIITKDFVIENIVLTDDDKNSITIKKMLINNIDFKSDIPAYLDVTLTDIDVISSGKSLINAFTDSIGYKKDLSFDIRLKYLYKSETGDFNLENLEVGSINAGKLSFSMNLRNIALDKSLPESIKSGQYSVLLNDAKISFKDDTITDRSLRIIADTIEMNLADFKSLINMQIDYFVKNSPGNISSSSLEKLKAYIKSPGQITILLKPSEPLALDQLISNYNKPVKIINLLNIDIQ